MTAPTLTYGHGYFTDMDSATYWGAKTDSADALTGVSITCNDGDVIAIEGTCDAAADEYVYYEYDMTNISSDTYPKITIRYKTSASSGGLGAKVVLVFTAGTQTVLDVSYSTSWTETTVAVTAAKTIDKIQIWADDTDAVAAGTFQVYYDFIMVHKGTFTFPVVSEIEELEIENKDADLGIPGRDGDIQQGLGNQSWRIMIAGDMDNWGTWGSGSGATQTFGEYLLDVASSARTEPFQWYVSDDVSCKMRCRKFRIYKQARTGTARKWVMDLVRYSKSSYTADSW